MEQGAYSYECAPEKNKKRSPDKKGLLTATNWFFDESLGLKQAEPGTENDFTMSMLRRTNLLNLNQENKGKITPEIMMKIMSTPIENGGPF